MNQDCDDYLNNLSQKRKKPKQIATGCYAGRSGNLLPYRNLQASAMRQVKDFPLLPRLQDADASSLAIAQAPSGPLGEKCVSSLFLMP